MLPAWTGFEGVHWSDALGIFCMNVVFLCAVTACVLLVALRCRR